MNNLSKLELFTLEILKSMIVHYPKDFIPDYIGKTAIELAKKTLLELEKEQAQK